MIKFNRSETDNALMRGFRVEIPSPMTLKISEGLLRHERSDGAVTKTFPSIEFTMESDEELPVSYDVYLLTENNIGGLNIHVDRTELGVMDVPVYEGETPIQHCLASILLPPKTTDLNDIDITINYIDIRLRGE